MAKNIIDSVNINYVNHKSYMAKEISHFPPTPMYGIFYFKVKSTKKLLKVFLPAAFLSIIKRSKSIKRKYYKSSFTFNIFF